MKLGFWIASFILLTMAIVLEALARKCYKKAKMDNYEQYCTNSMIFYVASVATMGVCLIMSIIDGKPISALFLAISILVIMLTVLRLFKYLNSYKIHKRASNIDEALNTITQKLVDCNITPVEIHSTCSFSEGDTHIRFNYTIDDSEGKSHRFDIYMTQAQYIASTEGLVDMTMKLYNKLKDKGIVTDLTIVKKEDCINEKV